MCLDKCSTFRNEELQITNYKIHYTVRESVFNLYTMSDGRIKIYAWGIGHKKQEPGLAETRVLDKVAPP